MQVTEALGARDAGDVAASPKKVFSQLFNNFEKFFWQIWYQQYPTFLFVLLGLFNSFWSSFGVKSLSVKKGDVYCDCGCHFD